MDRPPGHLRTWRRLVVISAVLVTDLALVRIQAQQVARADDFVIGLETTAPAMPGGRSAVVQAPSSQARGGVSGAEYQAPDGSISCRIPSGWKARSVTTSGTMVQVLEPQDGGEERILVSVTPATANSLQELAQQAMQVVTGQLLPGVRVAAMPRFT